MEDLNVFSLEDEEYGDMFITQTPPENKMEEDNCGENSKNKGFDDVFCRVKTTDFQSPVTSLVRDKKFDIPVYSDISDGNDDLEFKKEESGVR